MRKISLALIVTMVMVIGLISVASAEDKVLSATVERISVQPDKNGNDYGRIIINELRELNGVEYTASVAVMCFGNTVTGAQQLSAGDEFKAVVQENMYQGRKNYSVIQFIN